MNNSKRLYLHALTPVHSGIGQAADVVDLPIARERSTGWPVIPGSSMKGVLRDAAEGYDSANNTDYADRLFGRPPDPKTQGDQGESGRIALSDMRILFLPVRSFYGTFAWVTCPLALNRFERDCKALGCGVAGLTTEVGSDDQALVSNDSAIAKTSLDTLQVFLEDLDLKATIRTEIGDFAGAIAQELGVSDLANRIVVVSDFVFSFLCETATEIQARIALNERGTTSGDGGNLWYEEAVPAEAVFYGWAHKARAVGEPLLEFAKVVADNPTLFIGGNTTVGRGACRMVSK